MPLIDFPNVPDVPGVPAIARSVTVPTTLTDVLGLAEEILGDLLAAQWGVFDDSGAKILNPDSFLGIEFKNDERQSTYPVEQGGFQSYNKVNTPYDVRVKMAISEDEISRTAFLATCDTMLHSISLYTVITPEVSYANASLTNFSYRREMQHGATLLTVELWFQEIRSTATIAIATPSQPSGADAVSDGTVQTFPVANQPTITAQPIQ